MGFGLAELLIAAMVILSWAGLFCEGHLTTKIEGKSNARIKFAAPPRFGVCVWDHLVDSLQFFRRR